MRRIFFHIRIVVRKSLVTWQVRWESRGNLVKPRTRSIASLQTLVAERSETPRYAGQFHLCIPFWVCHPGFERDDRTAPSVQCRHRSAPSPCFTPVFHSSQHFSRSSKNSWINWYSKNHGGSAVSKVATDSRSLRNRDISTTLLKNCSSDGLPLALLLFGTHWRDISGRSVIRFRRYWGHGHPRVPWSCLLCALRSHCDTSLPGLHLSLWHTEHRVHHAPGGSAIQATTRSSTNINSGPMLANCIAHG